MAINRNIEKAIRNMLGKYPVLALTGSRQLGKTTLLKSMFAANMLRGFSSAIYDRDIPPKIFYSNYLQTYIQRDVAKLIAVKDSSLFIF